MLRNIIFIIFCFLFIDAVTPLFALVGLIGICVAGIWEAYSQKQTTANLIIFLYLGTIITTIGNIYLLQLEVVHKNVVYYYLLNTYVPEATLIWITGSLAIPIGFELANKIKLPTIAVEIKLEIVDYLFYFSLLYPVINYNLHLSFLGSIENLLSLVSTFSIYMFLKLWFDVENNRYLIYAIVLLITNTIYSLFFGYLRITLIYPALVFILGYLFNTPNIRQLVAVRLAPIYFYIFIVFSSYSALGEFRGLGKSNLQIIVENFSFENKNSAAATSRNSDEEGTVTERSANLAQLTQVVRLTKEKGFYNGSVSQILLVALVPRFLWPDKPLIELGTWFALESGIGYKASKDVRVNTSLNMTIPGQIFLDFGWGGLIIGCILLGIFLSALWNATDFTDKKFNITGTVFGMYLLMDAALGVGADLQIAVTLLGTYLLLFLVKLVLK
jgi:hypothetical protein